MFKTVSEYKKNNGRHPRPAVGERMGEGEGWSEVGKIVYFLFPLNLCIHIYLMFKAVLKNKKNNSGHARLKFVYKFCEQVC